MKYELAAEKAAVLLRKRSQSLVDDNFQGQPEIKITRRRILRLLSIELVTMTIYLILQIVDLATSHAEFNKIDKGTLIELFITAILIVYLTAFIIVVTGYFPVAIFIFACLTFIQLFTGCILLILAIMAMVVSLSSIDIIGIEILLDVVHIMVATSVIILSVLTMISSLNVMTLIKT